MVPVSALASGFSQLDVAAVQLLQRRLDDLVVLEDLVVVVALERNADERLRHVRRLHLLDRLGRAALSAQPADPADDLVRVILHDLVQFVDHLG